MFEQYTNTCRQVIMVARMEAGRLGSDAIDTEHLLMGVVRAESDLFGHMVVSLSVESVRQAAAQWRDPAAAKPTSIDMPLTNECREVLERTQSIADNKSCRFIRTEHLLEALLTVEHTHAATILEDAGASLPKLEALTSNVNCNENQDRTILSPEDLA